MIRVKVNELNERMIKKGFTQTVLAKEIGYSRVHIANILTDNGTLSPMLARKIYTALECTFDDLFEIVEKKGGRHG